MQSVRKNLKESEYKAYIDDMANFGWEKEGVIINDGKATVILKRDENLKNIEKLNQLQDKFFSFKIPPLWPMIVFSLIGFALITALLIMWAVNKGDFDAPTWFLYLAVPAFIFIGLATVYFGYRLSKMKQVYLKMDTERVKIKQEARLLLENERQDKDN